jgi:hypothetical protein
MPFPHYDEITEIVEKTKATGSAAWTMSATAGLSKHQNQMAQVDNDDIPSLVDISTESLDPES